MFTYHARGPGSELSMEVYTSVNPALGMEWKQAEDWLTSLANLLIPGSVRGHTSKTKVERD